MNLFDLEAFASVVETGSIVAASARLHLSQSAITRRVQNIEQELNVALLHRDARPLQPTEAGIYEHARRVLSSMNYLKSASQKVPNYRVSFVLALPGSWGI